MKVLIFTILAAVVAGAVALFNTHAGNEVITETKGKTNVLNKKQPVLVELFTSEGCSSCPPADRVLTTLQNDQLVPNADVITLAFHVDYWNYLGWKDRFSTAEFTFRQEAYARQFGLSSSYTPQLVVDGSVEFVGSSRAKANQIIAESSERPKPLIALELKGNTLVANVDGLQEHGPATIFLAVAESNLETRVGRGENSGKTLQHTSVVRELIQLGKVGKGERNASVHLTLPNKGEWKAENLKYVVFVQENSSLKVLAVGSVDNKR